MNRRFSNGRPPEGREQVILYFGHKFNMKEGRAIRVLHKLLAGEKIIATLYSGEIVRNFTRKTNALLIEEATTVASALDFRDCYHAGSRLGVLLEQNLQVVRLCLIVLVVLQQEGVESFSILETAGAPVLAARCFILWASDR